MDLVPPQHLMQRLVSALHASGAQDTLRALHINAERRWIISRKTMAPLLSLRNLTTLSIRTRCHPHPCPFHLSDADIAQLASSLRKLEVLILGGSRCTNPPPRFTMDSLFSLSAYCTSLLRLEVHFNAPQSRIFDRPASTTDEGRVRIEDILSRTKNLNLRRLYVHDLPFPTVPNSVGIMTYFLIHLFPSLEDITWIDGISDSWKETQHGIQAWQAFRRITVPAGT